jgi:nitric oxide reductase activation protein
LARRPEKRKVLFCLTDGKPVTGAWAEQVTFDHACAAAKRISRAGIEVVGIGILEECVADIFPRHAIIHNLQELPKGFMKQLCEVLSARLRKQ